ncbi:hypothetical protein [Neobacillus vireti]|uniref:hypothetical protein n=1 Tax=Neobacillus vireti TaxID=220686 RepID=UPI002FFE80EF
MIGRGGDSQAFAIALRLGMHPAIVERAHYITYKEEKQYLSQETEQWKLKELEKQVMINKYQQQQAAVKTEIPIYHQGDNVKISPANEFGIVYKGPDQHGNYLVLVKGEKVSINHKRLTIYIRADELYPENYDFDNIFQSKENRKKSKLLSKGYQENITIDYSE